MQQVHGFAIVAAIFSASLADANIAPKLSSEALFKRADIVAVVRVTSEFTGQLSGSVGPFRCWNATSVMPQKGDHDPDMVICLSGISERNPPAPHIGQMYQVYLQRSSSGALFPITKDSWSAAQASP